MRPQLSDIVKQLFVAQDGTCHRRQLMAAGVTRHALAAQLNAGRWQRLGGGVYANFNGTPQWRQRMAAAVLAAGPDACASHQSAAALLGFAAESATLHVTVPVQRRLRDRSGTRLHRSARLDATQVQSTRWPPRTRVDRTALDLVDAARSLDDAFGWLAAVCQQRLTTPARLLSAVSAAPEMRWRAALIPALDDIALGVHSQLERMHRRLEERHGLPASQRQQAARSDEGRRWLDCDYFPFRVRAELDGRLGHDRLRETWRDYRRDNDGAMSGRFVLRYGWADVAARPCEVAAQTARVLQQAGWSGHIRPCGPRCAALAGKEWST